MTDERRWATGGLKQRLESLRRATEQRSQRTENSLPGQVAEGKPQSEGELSGITITYMQL